MIPVTHPTFTNPFNGFGDCKVSYLSSVSGLVAWTDYIPVITVTASSSIEGRTEADGYQNVHPVGATGNVAWIDYIPVYEDATKTVPWSTDANGYIPVGMSEDGVLGFLSQAEFQADLTHSLVLDAGAGSPTFTRASTATVMGYGPTDNAVDGLKLLTVAANEARFVGARRISEGVWSNTFADGSLIPAATNTGYLAEGSRENKCLQSQTFDNATWANGGTPSATQNVVGPDGATSAWTLTDNDGAATEFIRQDITLTAATHTYSIFVKKTTGAQASYPMLIAFLAATTGLAAVTIDTSNGVATAWTAYTGFTGITGTATCTSYNANYWRVSLTFTGTAAAWSFGIYPAGTTNPTQSTGALDAAAQGSAVLYGAQVELGSSASTYIATTTAAVTRAADVDATPTASNILAAASTVYLEFTPDHTPSGTIALWGTYVDASNYTAILHDATNMIMRKRIAGVNYDATIANAFSANTTYKVCGSWGASGVTVTVNGTEGTPHANTTAAQIAATMQWGADGNSLQQPFATERNARVWQRQLSASERGAITA